MNDVYLSVVFVDIDDTLVRSVGNKRIPMLNTVWHVRNLFEKGATLYAWSSGGAEYARQSAAELGIEECFVGFLPKPNVLIDDQRIEDWRTLTQLHPNELDVPARHGEQNTTATIVADIP